MFITESQNLLLDEALNDQVVKPLEFWPVRHGKVYLSSATAKSLQLCPTLCDPIHGSPPGSPSLGFSRQERWNGLPFPSPMHESEK